MALNSLYSGNLPFANFLQVYAVVLLLAIAKLGSPGSKKLVL
jgi:hypothetical protein